MTRRVPDALDDGCVPVLLRSGWSGPAAIMTVLALCGKVRAGGKLLRLHI